ncbi:TcfC E-set like domain-containing protein [Pseudomonas japonica]|uniref:Outer membrane usher protein FimD/PapC n=2 Tax=Pseudomonas japonica TaxID=256466 RepID=A0A239I521_9PSED|nr:TcfC E-set like domain-containing protein [Pseudomonas japonica]SNS87424.1 Outer membrane usher protein FimD/PapC [Pseudomonas japonica]
MSLATSIRLAVDCCVAAVWLTDVSAKETGQTSQLGILRQAEGLPKEFDEHFFDVPLAVRIDLDGRLLGEAMVILGRDERVQLLEFTDTHESREPDTVRQRWGDVLRAGQALGNCVKACPQDLVAVHYSLVNSQLSILTRNAERDQQAAWHTLPEQGSHGVILRNQLNLSRDGQDTVGRYALRGQGSVGNWTTVAEAQVDRNNEDRPQTRHRVDQLFAERVHEDRFYRLGYFTPGVQGLSRQPRLLGSSPDTTVGVMFGSSDSLAVNNGTASATPIYVTPNRPGIVEIYRNGQLINSQPVQAGLQALDTRVLPGGIYEVEVRLIEDGQVTSRNEEFIYKPGNWSNTASPWRYNLYAGQQQDLLSNWDEDHYGGLAAGVIANYLVHPRVVSGFSAQRLDGLMQYGTSLDWDVLDRFKVFGNLFHTDQQGNGYDLQGVWHHDSGSVVFSHNRSWLEYPRAYRLENQDVPRTREVRQTSLSLSQRIDRRSTATLRVSHNSGTVGGTGVDLGWSQHGQLMGSEANWRVALFDRPGNFSSGNQRNRGITFSLSMSLGGPGRRINGSLGTRTSRDGGRDLNASVTYQQDLDHGTFRSLAGTVNADRYGTAFAANTQFENQALYGDAYVQNSSYNNDISAGLNLESTLALGGGKLALSGQYLPYEAGLIVDVETDFKDLKLRVDDLDGHSSLLRPGRNVIPVNAYKSGSVQLDFADGGVPAAVIQPSALSYHLNRGGVDYRLLRVMRTVTVLGRLLDVHGQPLKGAMVINHASRSVSEADGFFAVEMSESTPTLEIRQGGRRLCLLSLNTGTERQDDVLLAGDQVCSPDSLAGTDQSANGDA